MRRVDFIGGFFYILLCSCCFPRTPPLSFTHLPNPLLFSLFLSFPLSSILFSYLPFSLFPFVYFSTIEYLTLSILFQFTIERYTNGANHTALTPIISIFLYLFNIKLQPCHRFMFLDIESFPTNKHHARVTMRSSSTGTAPAPLSPPLAGRESGS